MSESQSTEILNMTIGSLFKIWSIPGVKDNRLRIVEAANARKN